MTSEIDVLKIISERLRSVGIPFMLTGSFALAWYATPRMTRYIDLVVAFGQSDVDRLVAAFAPDFYIDADDARRAVESERMFNLLHLESGVKVDFIVCKRDSYRQTEFERRLAVQIGDVETWIVSREDLILSKLVWGRDSGSEIQRRDVRALIDAPLDRDYLRHWASHLGILNLLDEALA